MNIRIGLVGDHPGWHTILQQEGLPYVVLDSPDALTDNFSAVVFSFGDEKTWGGLIREYLKRGGALWVSAGTYVRLFGGTVHRKYVRYLLPTDHPFFHDAGLADLYTRAAILDDAQFMMTDSGAHAVHVEASGGGVVAVLPVDFGTAILDRRVRWKAFYSHGTRLPLEQVSLVGRSGLRVLFRSLMEHLHHVRGLPYCHLWYFPDGVQNIFALRVDTDFGTVQEVDALFEFAEKHGVRLSWFLHVERHEEWLSRFARPGGHEIGLHCYKHAVLESYGPVRAELIDAIAFLRRAGLRPVGFAAPYGQSSQTLMRIVDELGFLYSSEFSYDYDNLPSHPVTDGSRLRALQVPIHPICIGSLRGAGLSAAEMQGYFERVISRKRTMREPLFFYHHPKDDHHDVLEHLVQSCTDGTRSMLMREFAGWWKERESASLNVDYSDGRLNCTGRVPPSVHLRVSSQSGEAIVPFSPTLDFSAIRWQSTPPSAPLPADIGRTRRFSWRRTNRALQTWLRRKRL